MADSQRTRHERRIQQTCVGCGCSYSVSVTHAVTQRFHSRACAQTNIHPPVTVRFWDKVNHGGLYDCWEWQRQRNRSGYGMFRNPSLGRSILAHRFSWELANGPILDGLFVCHSCDNPPCVNPAHLFLGTALDNNRDMRRKGRERNGERAKGMAHHAAKLTDDQVLRIRALGNSVVKSRLAEHFGVNPNTISKICLRQTWQHL